MFWLHTHLVFTYTCAQPDVDLSACDTVSDFRARYSTANKVLWDGVAKTSVQSENKAFLTYALYRTVYAYKQTGVIYREPLLTLLTAVAGLADSPLNIIVGSMRLESAVHDLMKSMQDPDTIIAMLTEQYFNEKIRLATTTVKHMNNSTMHTLMHIALMDKIIEMHELGRNMMHHYRISIVATSDVYTINAALSASLYFSGELRRVFWYKNVFLCYLWQMVPLANWAENACNFLDMLNSIWEVRPKHAERLRKITS